MGIFDDFVDGITDFAENVIETGEEIIECAVDSAEELAGICSEFGEEIIDTCMNEGVEVLKATPGAIIEAKDLVAPIISPTPGNIAKAAYRVWNISKN